MAACFSSSRWTSLRKPILVRASLETQVLDSMGLNCHFTSYMKVFSFLFCLRLRTASGTTTLAMSFLCFLGSSFSVMQRRASPVTLSMHMAAHGQPPHQQTIHR